MNFKPEILFLHGTCSSGKTAIAKELIQIIPESKHIESDVFESEFENTLDHDHPAYKFVRRLRDQADRKVEMAAAGQARDMALAQNFDVVEKHPFPEGMNPEPLMFQHSLDLFALGYTVIIDDVMPVDRIFKQALALLHDTDAFFIKVFCAPEVLITREAAREDHLGGLGIFTENRIHLGKVYDLELDTSFISPKDAATRVIDFVKKNQPRALTLMQTRIASASTFRKENKDEIF